LDQLVLLAQLVSLEQQEIVDCKVLMVKQDLLDSLDCLAYEE